MVLVITSPDNISINMFTEFLRKGYLHKGVMEGAPIVNLNGLLSSDVLEGIVEESLKHPVKNIIFRHKTRKVLQPSKIPAMLYEKADCIIGFELFSMHAEVHKSPPGWTENLLEEWDAYVARLNS